MADVILSLERDVSGVTETLIKMMVNQMALTYSDKALGKELLIFYNKY